MNVQRRQVPSLRRRLLQTGTALATSLLLGSGAIAQQVTLTTDDQDVTIQGDLVSFDRGVYVVNTIIGEISISGDNVICEGPGCPGAAPEADTQVVSADRSVTLVNETGGVRLEGELVAFDGNVYTVETIIGQFDVFAAGTTCSGPGCPPADAEPDTAVAGAVPEEDTTVAAAEPEAPAFEPIAQPEGIIPVVQTSDEPNLRLAGPASVVAGILPTLMDQLATVKDATADLVTPDLVSAQEAEAAGVGAGNLGATLSGADGAKTVVLARLQSSSDDALRSLNSGETDLAIVSAPAPLMQLGTRTETVLGNEGLVAIVSPDNPVASLTPAQIAQVYAGEITNWSEIGGEDQPIRVIGLPEGHDLSVMLDELILTPNLVDAANPEVVLSDATVVAQTVAETPGAIGFVGHASKGEAKDLAIGSSCAIATHATPENIRTARYPYSRAIMALSFSEDGVAADLLNRMDEAATDIVAAAGLEPVTIERFSLDSDAEALTAALPGVTDRFERINISNALRIMPAAERLGTLLRLEADGNRLTLRSQSELERVIDYVAENDLGEVFVVGYSHQTGTTETNRALGRITATSVMNAMRQADSEGVLDNTVIRTVSLGAASPMACDDAPDARAINQRAEIWVRRS